MFGGWRRVRRGARPCRVRAEGGFQTLCGAGFVYGAAGAVTGVEPADADVSDHLSIENSPSCKLGRSS